MPNLSRLLKSLGRRDVSDAIILSVVGVLVWYLAGVYDLFDKVYVYTRRHEARELDEVLVALMLSGWASLIYVIRRSRELQSQIRLRSEADRNVAWIAQHDLLTRLPNRHFLQNFIANIDKSGKEGGGKRYAVFAIDLDGFKKINDLMGNHGGDELLIAIAERLESLVKDDLVFRVGGDEFFIVAEWNDNVDVCQFAEAVINILSAPVKILENHVEVGACIGIARYPEDSGLIAETVRCADVAMFVAKNNGRGSVKKFQSWMDSLLVKRAEIEHSLRMAIKADEIIPNYQPLVNLADMNICGFEALARWTDQTGEKIPPSIFIEIAEESGLITTLTEKLLHKSCLDALTWPSNIRLSFNISPTQLTDRLLGLRILNILGETGLSPHRLEIEITESTLISDTDTAVRILHDLHDAGVSIAIDDFGTGYSSLSQLSQFDFDKIKIDRSFVSEFERDEKCRNVVNAMLTLGRGLGIATLAEGIETASQLEELKEMGCEMGQGYFFGEPVPASGVVNILNNLENNSGKKRQAG